MNVVERHTIAIQTKSKTIHNLKVRTMDTVEVRVRLRIVTT